MPSPLLPLAFVSQGKDESMFDLHASPSLGESFVRSLLRSENLFEEKNSSDLFD